jgi:hypothetical protein
MWSIYINSQDNNSYIKDSGLPFSIFINSLDKLFELELFLNSRYFSDSSISSRFQVAFKKKQEKEKDSLVNRFL